MQDLGFARRNLLVRPGITLVVTLTLALGIGSATAIFGVVDAVLLQPLPYAEPERLMTVWETSGDWVHNSASPANFLDWREQSLSFESLAAHAVAQSSLTGVEEPLRLRTHRVTEGFFRILGVEPAVGRWPSVAEYRGSAAAVAVLSHGFWRRSFGGDAGVIGTEIAVDGAPVEVVGIMPRGFGYPDAGTDLWMPLQLGPDEAARRSFRYLSVVGRLAAGSTPESALVELRAIARRLREAYPVDNENVSANVIPLREELLGRVRTSLLVVLAAVGLLLAIACANAANLLLARAMDRRGEVAVRVALGAGRGRVVRQLLIESALPALAGGVLGSVAGAWGMDFLSSLIPAHVPLAGEVGLDARVVVFGLGLSLVSSVLAGAAPALRLSRPDVARSLQGSGRRSADRGAARLRDVLVVAEVGLALVLLVGAGLLVRSHSRLMHEPLGFETGGLLTASLEVSGPRYEARAARLALYERVLEKIGAVPGVEEAAWVTRLPLAWGGGSLIYTPEGQPTPPRDAVHRVVTPGYLTTLGVPVRGRGFDAADREGAAPVIIVSEAFARRVWPDEEALGKRVKLGREDSTRPWRTVVGVAGDVRQRSLDLAPREALYLPHRQAPGSAFFDPADLLLRTAPGVEPASVAPALRAAVREVAPDVPVARVRTMASLVEEAGGGRRFQMQLFAAFAVAALMLSSAGIYGVMAWAVSRRVREVGIRAALGARGSQILLLVLREGLGRVAVGIVLGLAGAGLATRSMQSLLYEVEALDPTTFAAVPDVVIVVSALALLVPAVRASRVDPAVALRRD